MSKKSGINDYLDRAGSSTPIDFACGLGLEKRIEPMWFRLPQNGREALAQFSCNLGEGINIDMQAVSKDYFHDHDHSSHVDQWEWEKRITSDKQNLDLLKDTVKKI